MLKHSSPALWPSLNITNTENAGMGVEAVDYALQRPNATGVLLMEHSGLLEPLRGNESIPHPSRQQLKSLPRHNFQGHLFHRRGPTWASFLPRTPRGWAAQRQQHPHCPLGCAPVAEGPVQLSRPMKGLRGTWLQESSLLSPTSARDSSYRPGQRWPGS